MTQPAIWGVPRIGDAPQTPEDYADRADDTLDALLDSHSGPTAPSYVVPGTTWRRQTDDVLFHRDSDGDKVVSVGGLRGEFNAELTIAAGSITPTGPGFYSVDTEADAATDDLDTIVSANVLDGDVIILKPADSARNVIIRQGAGNITAASDVAVFGPGGRVVLQWDATAAAWTILCTGAPECGSNANGEYVRFADGTQICWRAIGSAADANTAAGNVYRSSADADWTFPAVFIAAPAVSAGARSSSDLWAHARPISTSAAKVRFYAATAIATTPSADVTAIGRWY